MQNWKKALVYGAVGAGAVLALTGHRKIGIASIAERARDARQRVPGTL